MKFRNLINVAFGTMTMLLLSTSCVVRLNKNEIMSEFNMKKAMIVTPSNVIASKDTVVGAFGKLSLSGSLDVYFTQVESAPSVKIVTSDNLIPYVNIALEGNDLKIGLNNVSIRGKGGDIKVYVSAPAINELMTSGSVDFHCDRMYNPDKKFLVRSAGSSDIGIGSVTSGSFGISGSGSTDIEIGNVVTGDASLSIAGSGDVEIDSLSGADLDMSIAGSGSIELNVSVETVSSSIAGSGDLKISGKAARSAEYSVAGSGSVDAKELIVPDTSVSVKGSGSVKYRDADGNVRSK